MLIQLGVIKNKRKYYKEEVSMFVRLTLADVKEGEIDNALEYVKNTVIPSYDGVSGLLGVAACATNLSLIHI